MNLPNILTLSRIPLLFLVVGLLHLDSKWHWPATVAFIVFVIAALTDYFDGYYARKMKLVSDFGKLMDAITDKILVLGLFAVLIAFDLLPKWGVLPFLVILSREFLITGLRLLAATKGVVLAAENAGKIKTVVQLVSLHCLLAVPMVRDDWDHWTGLDLSWLSSTLNYAGQVSFGLSALLTATSGYSYLSKYGDLMFPAESGSKTKAEEVKKREGERGRL